MTRKRTILFLCTGDTCRGPMAVGLMRKLLADSPIRNIEVRSSGVMTVNGLLATSESVQMLTHEGVELGRHRSTPLTEDLLRRSDLVLGMTPLHIQQALRMAPGIRGKAYLLKEYAGMDPKKVQIDDPMGNTLEVYKRVFNEIRTACTRLMKRPFIAGRSAKEPPRPPKKTDKAPAKPKERPTGKTPAAPKTAPKTPPRGAAKKPAPAVNAVKRPAAKPAPRPAKVAKKRPSGAKKA